MIAVGEYSQELERKGGAVESPTPLQSPVPLERAGRTLGGSHGGWALMWAGPTPALPRRLTLGPGPPRPPRCPLSGVPAVFSCALPWPESCCHCCHPCCWLRWVSPASCCCAFLPKTSGSRLLSRCMRPPWHWSGKQLAGAGGGWGAVGEFRSAQERPGLPRKRGTNPRCASGRVLGSALGFTESAG